MNFGILGNITEEEMDIAVNAIEEKRKRDNIKNLEQELSDFLHRLAEQGLHVRLVGGEYMPTCHPLTLDAREGSRNSWSIY